MGGSKDIFRVCRTDLPQGEEQSLACGHLELKERYRNCTENDITILRAGCSSSPDSAIMDDELLHGPSRGKEGLARFRSGIQAKSKQNILRGTDVSKGRCRDSQYPALALQPTSLAVDVASHRSGTYSIEIVTSHIYRSTMRVVKTHGLTVLHHH